MLFETVPQIFLQLRILNWKQNYENDESSKFIDYSQLMGSIFSSVVHALMEMF